MLKVNVGGFPHSSFRIHPSSFSSRVEGVAEAVAEEVEAEESEGKGEAGEDQEPRILLHAFGAFFDEHAPGTHGRLDSETEETQERFQQHDAGNSERGIDD